MTEIQDMLVCDYEPMHQPWFEGLNRAWIEEHFFMEEIDQKILQHPDKYILDEGGVILMAYLRDEVAGTAALKFVSDGVYEFTKMAVDPKFRRQKIGTMLANVAIARAKKIGATKVVLYSSTKLKNALALYRSIGFTEVPVDKRYQRSDIKMELNLD